MDHCSARGILTEADMDLLFIINSAALGVGLAMDAFSVSLANGLHDPGMRGRRTAVQWKKQKRQYMAALPSGRKVPGKCCRKKAEEWNV
jgi:hypothetical protein